MNQHTAFPLAEPAQGWKRALRRLIGHLLCALMPSRALRLLTEGDPQHFSKLDRMMAVSACLKAQRQGDWEATRRLHTLYWAGDAAAGIHREHTSIKHRWFQEVDHPLAIALKSLIEAGACRGLCEIGCGTGALIEDLRQRYPQLSEWTGLDLSPQQISENREAHAGSGVRYESADALLWIPQQAPAGWIYLSFGGVLEYLTEQDLRGLWAAIAAKGKPAAIALCEPIADDHDFKTTPNSRVHGVEQVFSHHYQKLASEAGFKVLTYRDDLRFSRSRWAIMTAVIT